MKAIHTRYLPATEHKGSRIKAYTGSGMAATISFPYGASPGAEGHFLAVRALVEQNGLGWDCSVMCWGDSSDGRGYTFVFPKSTIGG